MFCEAGILVYCDPTIRFHMRPFTRGGAGATLKRTVIGGIPYRLQVFSGPGYAAFSRCGPGEVRILELAPGETVEVAEHSLLLASASVKYDVFYVKGTGRVGRMVGFWMDRLTGPGTIAIHGHGNIQSFELPPTEVFDVDHGAVLLKHDSVRLEAFNQPIGQDLLGRAMSYEALRVRGPGKLLLQTLDPTHSER
ncbi:MAG: AIM24 family protein [Euryarchaeota archaeon]|nr:AIM24 family protein [Euryarchaeota archaeon]MDE1835876.1 AIM24 family protein [Euryarchaeota archaeon]MDE1881383.1 AIM24 family protein [Euryarchaeota archaeon]MDE2044446.1 AIM24 family protein [Thermoplasmata archaeon]